MQPIEECVFLVDVAVVYHIVMKMWVHRAVMCTLLSVPFPYKLVFNLPRSPTVFPVPACMSSDLTGNAGVSHAIMISRKEQKYLNTPKMNGDVMKARVVMMYKA